MKNEPDSNHLLDSEIFAKAYSEAIDYKNKLEGEDLFNDLQEIDERYEKLQLLGEGAVKKVWLAYDKLMDRQVALAQIKNDDPGLLNDFLNEARLSSTLEHPYIAPVYDLGFTSERIPYFVMKLYEGRNLKEELDNRQQEEHPANENINWILNVFLKVCEAVSFAHSKGVLHLDIKPSNIRIDDYGEVLLCDWGIARLISNSGIETAPTCLDKEILISRATLVGEVRGTPGFMAPEQITKETPCDERTDIYGLGALLHDMITGKPPVKRNSSASIDCPDEIEAILRKAISEESKDRYQTVHELISDIEKYKSGMVTMAENASSLLIFRKWLSRHKKAVITITANLVVLTALLAVYIKSINKNNDNLEVIIKELNQEKKQKAQDKIAMAEKYYQQSFETYCNIVSNFDYDPRDSNLATDMIIRSLELNPNDQKAWGLSGILRTLRHDYVMAAEHFSKAGSKFQLHSEILSTYTQEFDNYRKREEQLELARRIDLVRDQRFRNHLIFKNIHERKDEDLRQFALGAVAIVNRLDEVKWSYDDKTETLDLSGNPIRVVYPLKTSRFARLNLSHTRFHAGEFYNLRRIPLKYLDVSYSHLNSLHRFLNEEIEELNLEGCPIKDLRNLSRSKIRKLNIYKTKAQLETLRSSKFLEEVICSQQQAEKLKKILPNSVKLTVVAH